MKNKSSQLKTEGATVEASHLTCRSNANTADSHPSRQAERFVCNCSGGETRAIDATHLEHKCGFRPSASYGSLGIWTPYVADSRGRWWVDWKSTPIKS